jgi:hypothetical protein
MMSMISICSKCNSLWTTTCFSHVNGTSVAELSPFETPITYGCLFRLFAFLDDEHLSSLDKQSTFHDIISKLMSLTQLSSSLAFKSQLPLFRNIKQSVMNTLRKNPLNCCFLAKIIYEKSPVVQTSTERVRVFRTKQSEIDPKFRQRSKKSQEDPSFHINSKYMEMFVSYQLMSLPVLHSYLGWIVRVQLCLFN